MVRPSYGPEAKKRSKQLLAVLLDYANDELNCDESTLDALRPQIQVYWQTEQRLIVRTKIRFLETLTKLGTDSLLSGEQIKEALRRFEDFLEILEDHRPNRGGSEIWHFTLNLWYKRSHPIANLERFEQEWEQRRPQKSKQVTGDQSEQVQNNFWWELCRESLELQDYQRLTTNVLTVPDGVAFDLHEVYIPLKLVERKQQDRRSVDISAEQGSQFYEPEELETALSLTIAEFCQRFFQSELKQRIAIVGEPGSGKTTLLQKIATWLLEHQVLPIWISLADLQGSTLEHYLLNDWLKQATHKIRVSEELQEGLAQQFHLGKVWLLLDAVDEMADDASMALSMIARQLRGWVGDGNVVLTCRLNVWDHGKNALHSFTTYRNLSFSYGDTRDRDQVGAFIQRWFSSRPEFADRLHLELNKIERKRIKDTVKNPLRLALLCRTWSLAQGNLPNTKATLYQQFVETIYEWKQDRFPTTPAQRQQLNQVLGKLALFALEQPEIKFRLSYSFLQQAFAESLELIPLALQLGWLNQVGIAANSGEKVYAFYHPTFQEYFAAQTITDWHFFFDPKHNYPIFSQPWQEVIFLWLGRSDVSVIDKEAFLQALTEFDDQCGGFYAVRAYFIAAVGLAEFPHYSKAEIILSQLIDWRFAVHRSSKFGAIPLSEDARIALLKTDRSLAILGLEKFISSVSHPFIIWNAAYTLGRALDPGNLVAIAALIRLLDIIQSEPLRLQISEHLGKVDPGNAIAIATLVSIIESASSLSICRKAAYSLGKICPEHPLAIATLERLVATTDLSFKRQVIENLLTLDPGNVIAIAVRETIKNTRPQTSQKRPKKYADTISIAQTIKILENKLDTVKDPDNLRRIAYRLGNLQPGHSQAIEILIRLLTSANSSGFHKQVSENLKEIITDEQLSEIVSKLKPGVNQDGIASSDRESDKMLWYCAQRMTYDRFYQAWNG